MRLYANPMELELAILNILRNAADSLISSKNQDPKIELIVQRINDTAILKVTDNGPLVSEKELEDMTVPLNSSKLNGLGIGLSLVRTIMENHGGNFDIEPLKYGGVCATLTLKIMEDQNA